jgi:hypothetical protein
VKFPVSSLMIREFDVERAVRIRLRHPPPCFRVARFIDRVESLRYRCNSNLCYRSVPNSLRIHRRGAFRKEVFLHDVADH